MSKKSRRRNKKILGALLLGGLGLAARNRRNAAIDAGIKSAEDDSGSDMMEFKEKVVSTPVSTKTTIMDSMPARPKRNPLSKRIKKNTNEVYTIKGGNTGVGNTKSVFKGDDGYLRQGENSIPMTPGRYGTYKAAQEMKRGMLPPQLRGTFKSGGKVKGCGKALRGFGRAMKKGKK